MCLGGRVIECVYVSYEREAMCASGRETEEEKWKILYEVIGKRKKK